MLLSVVILCGHLYGISICRQKLSLCVIFSAEINCNNTIYSVMLYVYIKVSLKSFRHILKSTYKCSNCIRFLKQVFSFWSKWKIYACLLFWFFYFIIVFPILKRSNRYTTLSHSYQYYIKYCKLYCTINKKILILTVWMSIAMSKSVLGKVNIKETDYTLNALEKEDLVNLDCYTLLTIFCFIFF